MSRDERSVNDLASSVLHSLECYFNDLNGEPPTAIYDMVMRNVERPLLEFVLQRAGGNQTQAAEILGINRNTLRRKLAEHGLL